MVNQTIFYDCPSSIDGSCSNCITKWYIEVVAAEQDHDQHKPLPTGGLLIFGYWHSEYELARARWPCQHKFRGTKVKSKNKTKVKTNSSAALEVTLRQILFYWRLDIELPC